MRITEAVKVRDTQVKQITKELDEAIQQLGPSPIPEKIGHIIGPLIVLSGIGTATIGGNVALGMKAIGLGVFEIMIHDRLIRLLNTVKGAQFLRRAARTVPGTVQSIAAVRVLDNFAKGLKGDQP